MLQCVINLQVIRFSIDILFGGDEYTKTKMHILGRFCFKSKSADVMILKIITVSLTRQSNIFS